MPIVFLLFQMALRGPQDYVSLMRVLFAAACTRALLAVYIIRTVIPPPPKPGEEPGLAYATTHHDTMLFAVAFVLVLALLSSAPEGKKPSGWRSPFYPSCRRESWRTTGASRGFRSRW